MSQIPIKQHIISSNPKPRSYEGNNDENLSQNRCVIWLVLRTCTEQRIFENLYFIESYTIRTVVIFSLVSFFSFFTEPNILQMSTNYITRSPFPFHISLLFSFFHSSKSEKIVKLTTNYVTRSQFLFLNQRAYLQLISWFFNSHQVLFL